MIGFQLPYSEVSGRGHEGAIVIVGGVAEHIVVAVNLSAGFQQLYLVGESPFGKHADGLFRCCLIPAERHVETYNLLHALMDGLNVLIGKKWVGGVWLLLEVTIVSPLKRMLHEELRTWKYILCCLVEHETERAHVGIMARAFAGVEKLHITVLKKAELQALWRVVHLCSHNWIRQFQLSSKVIVNFEKRRSLGKTSCLFDVLAAYL